jgi:hypothetical protein
MLAPLLIPAMSEAASPFERLFVVDRDHVIDQRCVEVLGNKARTDPLNAMLARLAATDHR